ncbi:MULTISPECIES: hypothetical protein [Brenneria]|uniref:Uncharacterized protein n=1 Tax=Brenneria nigrifluens DSM 30175 = ATCC 13028 TaxID=1121120 RepID=A0A2U1UUT9_9GAMM|nr:MULTISPECIES: hypothetical protein [Brenneria]EHD22093.1 hypothetical protein BrE312_2717 [Brenneria sp. EniD312]PWC25423.1 hypothetical protein DDT54_05875 [Brenneria nigrifluens DSM 30175 = ATCC 13028]QCR05173.1 hypothetical protein EH206_13830 [Brenneria nigrifluens DSM 30175 = ATCC 13028]
MTTTDVIFPKRTVIDDGCDYTALILWRMNANARARTRSPYVPAPVPVQVVKPKLVSEPKVRTPKMKARKTHTGTVIRNAGRRQVRLSETATGWIAGPNEVYYKNTGARIGSPGRSRLLLDSIQQIGK